MRAWGKATVSDFRDALIEHAARALPSWHVPSSDPSVVSDAEFLVAMARHRSPDPRAIDDILQRASRAFVAGDSMAARRAYEVVLRPLWNGDIWLPGVDEFPDEVLTTSTYDACARLPVATYETAAADERVEAMIEAVELVDEAQQLCLPIRMMEQAAVRPLQGLDSFLPLWLEKLRATPNGLRDSKTNDLIREATLRVDGVDGLARIARASKSQESYDSWCRALREGQQWPELLEAVLEAASLPASAWETASWQDEAAALRAKAGQPDLVRPQLEAALAAAPTLDRVLRLIDDGAPTGDVVRHRAQVLLRDGQRRSPAIAAVLKLLAGDHGSAAALLAAAPGNGWSGGDHPGPATFPSLVLAVGGTPPAGSVRAAVCAPLATAGDSPFESIHETIRAPALASLLERCGALGSTPAGKILEALRTAAWNRIDGVTSTTHRSRYSHGARLAVCVAELQRRLGDRAGAEAWLEMVRRATKRWPRFQAELAEAMSGTR
ncbi:MAG: hypothetical protein MUF54_01370 [Polyangiaceae bacterium]|nr:hypothetical protein [Polyangiaceae bacterium]